MSVWRRTRTEMAGAWRSLRYDMGRRPFEAPADGPDVTSTGMSTFAGMSWDYGPEPTEMPVAGRMPAPRRRSPRRAVAMSAFGLLTVVGAAGSYLVVVNGLVPMRDEQPAAAGTVPPAVATADTGIGPSLRSPKVAPARSATDPAPVIGTRPPRKTDVVAPLPPPRATKPPKPAIPDCHCDNPPVPTPTAPTSSPSPTPSAPASPSASASNSDDPSTDPSESVEPRKSWKPGHHRRHR